MKVKTDRQTFDLRKANKVSMKYLQG